LGVHIYKKQSKTNLKKNISPQKDLYAKLQQLNPCVAY